jgi:hypothetical protein
MSGVPFVFTAGGVHVSTALLDCAEAVLANKPVQKAAMNTGQPCGFNHRMRFTEAPIEKRNVRHSSALVERQGVMVIVIVCGHGAGSQATVIVGGASGSSGGGIVPITTVVVGLNADCPATFTVR